MKRFIIVALVALGLAPTAAADAPAQETTPWDRTRIELGCGFPIQVHSSGTIRAWTYSDGTQKTILQDFRIEWTKVSTGETLSSPLGGPAIQYPDGTLVINGMNGRLVGQPHELGYVDIGRTVFDAEGLVFAAGQHRDALFPNVCEAFD
jgi:hypothetical protein